MTATIYKFADYVQPKASAPKRKEKNFVVYNQKNKCYFMEEESTGVFNWTPNLLESVHLSEDQALLLIARLRWWYPDHSIKKKHVPSIPND